MKKIVLVVILLMFSTGFLSAQDARIAAYFNVPTVAEDSVLAGLMSIRGSFFHPDPLGDGVSAIVVTNYSYYTVQVFGAAGNDAIELKWVSPVNFAASGSTPRFVVFGDLDNDGLIEIIYQLANIGVVIFEWDGIPGSWNFGTAPSQIINLESLAGSNNGGNAEYLEVLDVDGDATNELLVTVNSTTNETDRYYIISAIGDWTTDNSGFSSFILEQQFIRTDLANWGVNGGSPYDLISANLDGTGNPEIILHNWNKKNVVPIRVTGADTYLISDTTNGNQNFFLGGDIDDVALFSGVAADVDGDGREEVYLPTYPGDAAATNVGYLHMIHYESGSNTAEITADNVFLLDMSGIITSEMFGIGYGDLDDDGKINVYIGGARGLNITSAEFQGGDKLDINNWLFEVIYPNEPDIYNTAVYTDSAGVLDTSGTINTAFVSKLYAKNTDFDGDGLQDIIMPYQGLNDSTTVINRVWNGTKYDSTTQKILNPKRWGLRILESGKGTGIDVKDITIITPENYILEQNYPNPFNPNTSIRFSLPLNKRISLTIYDILGREIKTLIDNQDFVSGAYEVDWDGTNNFNGKVASGTYIYTLKFGNFSKSIKMSLLK